MLNSVNETNKLPAKKKKTVYIETNERIRDKVNIFEDRERKNRTEKEEEDYWIKLFEQNKKNNREKMRRLKFLFKDNMKVNEEFYEQNKKFLEEIGIKSYEELLKLINAYDKENKDYQKDMIENYKKNLKIEKQLNQEGKNGFSIIPPINKFENIEISNINDNNISYPK